MAYTDWGRLVLHSLIYSLVSGVTRIGFEAVGGKCVWASEWDTHSQKAYSANFVDDHAIEGDITEISADAIPDHNVLVGGLKHDNRQARINRPGGYNLYLPG